MKRISGLYQLDEKEDSYWKTDDGHFMLYLRGVGVGDLSKHQVAENLDGTITVTPSILLTGHNAGNPTTRHGHITNGVWSEA